MPIRALRIWDERADPLPQAFLNDFPSVPPTLEYLAWDGKKRDMYRLEKENGVIKAVRWDGGKEIHEKEEWWERRILDI